MAVRGSGYGRRIPRHTYYQVADRVNTEEKYKTFEAVLRALQAEPDFTDFGGAKLYLIHLLEGTPLRVRIPQPVQDTVRRLVEATCVETGYELPTPSRGRPKKRS